MSVTDAISRILGLLFMTTLVQQESVVNAGLVRTIMPIIGVCTMVGSVGLSHALTRWTSVNEPLQTRPRRFTTIIFVSTTTTCILVSCLSWQLVQESIPSQTIPLSSLYEVPCLITLVCINSAFQGSMLGMRQGIVCSISQLLEVCARLAALWFMEYPISNPWIIAVLPRPALPHTHFGINGLLWTFVIGEGVRFTFYVCVLCWQAGPSKVLPGRGTFRAINGFQTESRSPAPPKTGSGAKSSLVREYMSISRMTAVSTLQASLSSITFACEFPFLAWLFAPTLDIEQLRGLFGAYVAVCLPMICGPMVITDTIAAVFLSSGKELQRKKEPEFKTQQILLSVTVWVGALWTLSLFMWGDTLIRWVHAPGAAPLLRCLCTACIPLYLQAPLASLLQSQGWSRGVIGSYVIADVFRFVILLGMSGKASALSTVAMAYVWSVWIHTTLLLIFRWYRGRVTTQHSAVYALPP